MKTTKITSNKLDSPLSCPTSKSYANRAIILAALNSGVCKISHLPASKDVDDLLINLKEVGLDIEASGSEVKVKNSFPDCEKSAEMITLSGSEGGTTIRFLISLLAMGKNRYKIPLLGRLSKRPMDNQIEILRSMGAQVEKIEDHVLIQGPIDLSLEVQVDCRETTQFASSLMLIGCTVHCLNINFSKNYLDMTRAVIENFSSDYSIPPDFSSLSYILAYGFLNQDLQISNIYSFDSNQGDSQLIEIIKLMGADISIDPQGLKLKKGEAKCGINIDISNCLDLFPTLAYLAMFIQQPCEFSGLSPLAGKESDRLSEVLKIYDYFNMNYDYQKNSQILKTQPSKLERKTQLLSLPNDHRIVMMGALILKQLGGGELNQAESVNKSFSEFFEIF